MSKDKQIHELQDAVTQGIKSNMDVDRIVEAIDRNTAALEKIAAAVEKVAWLLDTHTWDALKKDDS